VHKQKKPDALNSHLKIELCVQPRGCGVCRPQGTHDYSATAVAAGESVQAAGGGALPSKGAFPSVNADSHAEFLAQKLATPFHLQ